MNSPEYKKFHESYMQNNHGSTAFHTFCCIFFTVQCSVYVSIRSKYPKYKQYIYEYIVIVLPMILAHTILAEYIYFLNVIMFTMLLYRLFPYFKEASRKFDTNNVFKFDRVPLISTLRGLTYLITVFCILAVDFRDFPRYLAKTERYGYSLMDTGVGLFVTMSGLVHKELPRGNFLRDLITVHFKFIAVLTMLGIGRFVSVKHLDYQEHVTEYGVHWNFFFTVAACKILSSTLLYLSDQVLLLSISTLVFHEFVLYIGLQDWVFSNSPRDSLLSANREGISSCLGYVAIYFFAVHIRNVLLTKNVTKYEIFKKIVFRMVIMWTLMYCDVVRPTSRTLANASYCIFIGTLLVTITTFMYFVSVLNEEKDNSQIPYILLTINKLGLPYFLVANFTTGAINITMRTLLASSVVTFIILNIYMIAMFGIIEYLKKEGIIAI